MSVFFSQVKIPSTTGVEDWQCWKWQMRNSLKSIKDFENFFSLSASEKSVLDRGADTFSVKTTPYYAQLCKESLAIRKMTLPLEKELDMKGVHFEDPLGEKAHSPLARIVHRYPDRVLFLVTDFCGIYCRYCTRKHFTSKGHHFVSKTQYQASLDYIANNPGIREVILSGGDPLTLSDDKLDLILSDIRSIDHIEIIRIGSRMPVVCPFRITQNLVSILKKYQPVFIMTHFNHPMEVSEDCKKHLLFLSDSGISVLNQMVLLNGINNHPALVQALCRRLLYLRVKPYYMFQCDPSKGSDHFRTSIENSKWIQKELWGVLSGLATPNLSVDLPGGGGKVGLVPNHFIEKKDETHIYEGFDGMRLGYENPQECVLPNMEKENVYLKEWEVLLNQPYGNRKDKSSHLKTDESELEAEL